MSLEALYTCHGLLCAPKWRTQRRVAGGTCVDIAYLDSRTTALDATVNAANLVRHNIRDAIEWAAVDRENGFRHLTADKPNGHAHGLFPVWDGVEINARAKETP